jgi:transcriptional regulator with XRE-family HTH domain
MAVSKSAAAADLGVELARLRRSRGLTLRELETRSGVANSQTSQYENGHRLPTAANLDKLLDALQAPEDQCEAMHAKLREAGSGGTLATGSPIVGDPLSTLIEHERRAVHITEVAPLLIPGLLQTTAYAEAIFGDSTAATLRTGRREVLTRRSPAPAELVALIDSEALVRPIGPPEVMLDQLQHLIEMAERPNISVQVWSSTRRGWHAGLTGPFVLLEFAASPPMVHIEHHSSSAFVWEKDDVQRFADAAQFLRREVAMTPQDSVGFIADIAHGMETST